MNERACKNFFSIVSIALFLAIVTLLSCCVLQPCIAEGLATDYIYVDETTAVGVTQKLTSQFYGEPAQINNVEKIYNMDDTLYGYKVDFSYQNYYDEAVILDTCDTNLIVNQFSVFTENNDKNMRLLSLSPRTERLYVVAPYSYGYKTTETTYTMMNGAELKYESDVKMNFSPRTQLLSDTPINGNILDNYSGTIKKSHDILGLSGITCVRQSAMQANAGNCGPTAAVNILNYWNHTGKDIFEGKTTKQVYDEVVNYMGWDQNSGSNLWQIETGVKDFVKNTKNYTASTFVYWGAFWGYYKSDLDKGKPIIHAVIGKENGEKVGHAMAAYGYLETTSGKYLKIAFGWRSYLQYINFDTFSTKYGSFCTLKEK